MSQNTWEKRKREVLGQSEKTNHTPTTVVNIVSETGKSAGSSGSAWSKRKQEVLKNAINPATATESRSPVGSGISSRDDWYRVYRGRVGNQQAKYNKLKTLLETMEDYDIEDFETVKKDLQYQLTEIESSPAYRNSALAKKYAGKTSAQLETMAKQATDLYEKSWLESASKATMTDEDYKYRIARNTDEKRRLEAMFAEVPNSGSFLQSVYASTPVAAGTKHGTTKAELAKKYGYSSWKEATDRYDAIERELYFDTNARKYHAIPGAEDFEEKSQYDESKGVGVEAGEHAQYNRLNQMDMEGAKVGPALLRDKYDYMSEEQRAIYNYIYNTEGKESAEEYLDYMSYQYNTERQTGIQRDAVDFTDSGIGKAVASGVSVPLRLASGIALVDVAGQKIRNAITGENRPVDFNTGIWSSRSAATGLRTGMAQNFNELSGTIQLDEEQYPVLSKALNGIGAGDLYSLGMSMADSAVVAALSPIIGPGGVALLASSAGAEGIQTALENGATENQAIAMGAINGTAEALFEYLSLDNLLKGDPKTVLKAALKQGGIEASEEGATSIANIIGDYLVMAENSEWQKDIAMYMNGGDDVKTATWKAFWGKVAEVAMDSIGGALSGSVMGGGTTAVQNAQAQVQFGDQMSDILENAAQYGVDSNATNNAQSKVDAGKKVSGATIRQVMEETQAAQQNIYTQEAMSVLAQVEIDGDQELLATAIGKYIAGQTLTRSERTEMEQNDLAPVVVAIVRRNIEQRQNNTPAEWAAEQEPYPVTATETAQGEQILTPVEVEGEAQKTAPVAEIGRESASGEATEETLPMSVAEDEAEELQKNAKTYGEEAEAYLASFESGQNVAEYDTAWKAGYELGISQVPQAQAMESSDLAYLTPGQRVDAYEAGLKAAGVLAGQKETRLNSMTRNATGARKRGIVRAYNGINTSTLAQKFNDSQRKAYKILSAIADVTGIEIVLYESTPEADGVYREDQGKYIRSQPGRIFVDLNAGLSHVSEVGDMANYTMLATFTHEFVHFCENWNPIRYNELRKAVFDAMAENNINVEERIDQLMAESKGELTREDASREAVAEALVEILPDANFVEQLANEHKTLFRKLLERLKEFLKEIKDYFAGMRKSNDPTVAALKEEVDGMTRYMEHIVKLFDNVAVEAVNRRQEIEVVEGEEDATEQNQRRPGATFVSREAMQEYRHKRHESELKKRYKMRIRKTIMDLDKLLNRGTKQANVKEEMRELVSGTLRAADMLFMDEYTAADMIRSGIGVELTDREAAHLEKAKDILAQMDAIAGSSQESMQKRDSLKKQLDAQMAQMREVFQRERKRIYGAKVADVLNQLSNLYSGLSDSEAGFIQAAYDENVAEYLRNLHKLVGDVTVRDMSAEQMENLSKAFTMILTKVRTANKAFAENIRETIETLARDTIAQEEAQKTRQKGRVPALDSAEALWFNNEKPVYAFERIGSNTLSKLYGNVADGENTFAEDINEAKEFKESIAKKYRMTEWDFKGTKTFRSSSGLEFELNLGHLMSLYAYAKRPAAHDHITKGGIVFPTSTKIRKKVGPFQMTVRLRDATAYNISDELLQEILSDTNLTQEQKAFVDEMQDYLSFVMGEKGNEVSLAMYGIRQFGEKNYFPIRSSATYMAKAEETELKKQAGQATLASAGFTKATVPKASNPIVLDEFMSVWANHVNEMSLYHAFVLPLADFQRVYNYNTPNREGEQSKSVKAAISNAHGDAATRYIRQLISDVNGGVMADPRETMVKKLISGFKKASVLASWSVLVQQPSAMYRAEAMIDRKYFGPIPVVGDVVALSRGIGRALLAHKQHVKLWEQAKKYAPGVVTIKEIGGFDTATGKGIEDYLANTERQGIKNKAKAFVSDSQYRSAAWENTLGAGPAVADELAWVEIWLACKRETMAKHPGMKWDSEELLQLSGERFTEVIRKTQVYDSIFAKSSYMRSKSSAMAMMTSFMAEPTTTINMAEEMISDLAHGRVKKAGKIGAAIVKTMVVNNLLKALIYAMRDEDEDETWLEKYAESVASGLANDINPINYYPYLRDVGSLLSGYEVERADATLVSDVVDSAQKIYTLHNKDTSGMDETELAEHEKAEAAAWWDLTGTVAACFGIPADNVKRELFGLVNLFQTVERDIKGRDTSKESFFNAVWEGVNESLPFFWQKDTGDKRGKLYKAVVSGDESYRKRLESGYKDEDAYHAALRKALRENDPRIKEAAKARYDGDIAKYSDIAKAILAEKHFAQDDILAAIDSEVALLEPEGYKGDPKAKGLYKASDFAAIAQDGEWQLADAIQEDMIATYKLNGKSQRQAETACANAIKSEIKDGSMAGNISKENAIHALTLAADMDEEEAKAQYDDWMTELQYGVSNSEVKSAYMDGKITKETAIEIRMAYTGDSREKVSKTIRDWDAEQATGYVYSDIEKEFLKGRITSGEAIKMYKVYGESDADARQTVTKLEFQKRWPGSDGITAEAVEKYQAFCANAGVPGTSYYQAWKFSANTTADVGKDGKAISGSKKKKVLNYVNTLPLTSKQKDAIYYAFGWAKSTLSEAPWH